MELKELLEKRLHELVLITNTISSQSSEYKKRNEEIIKEVRESGDSEEDKAANIKRIGEMKRINSSAYLRANEVGINIRIMNEIYSLMRFLGIEPTVSDKDLEILEFNLANVKPTFILDKGEVVFFDKQVEEFVNSKLQETDHKDLSYIENIKKFNITDGKG